MTGFDSESRGLVQAGLPFPSRFSSCIRLLRRNRELGLNGRTISARSEEPRVHFDLSPDAVEHPDELSAAAAGATHRRTPRNMAQLALGLKLFLDFAEETRPSIGVKSRSAGLSGRSCSCGTLDAILSSFQLWFSMVSRSSWNGKRKGYLDERLDARQRVPKAKPVRFLATARLFEEL